MPKTTMTEAAVVQAILTSWATNHPEHLRNQPEQAVLQAARARASMAEDEMEVYQLTSPGMSREEAWGMAAPDFLRTPPLL